MALQFKGGKCHGGGEAKAMMRHADKDERLKHNHSNEDISKELTHNNTSLYGYSYTEKCELYDTAIKSFERQNGKAFRKDAVTLFDIIITKPKYLPADKEDNWYKDVADKINDFYGYHVVLDMDIHRDEIHDYVDPDTKKTVTSRTHAHCFVLPIVKQKDGSLKFCGKDFSSRSRMQTLNRQIDEMTKEQYHCQFLTGEKTVDRAFQTVEQLKRKSDSVALDVEIEHKQALNKNEQFELKKVTNKKNELQYQNDLASSQLEQTKTDIKQSEKELDEVNQQVGEKYTQLDELTEQVKKSKELITKRDNLRHEVNSLSRTKRWLSSARVEEIPYKTTIGGDVKLSQSDFTVLLNTAAMIDSMQRDYNKRLDKLNKERKELESQQAIIIAGAHEQADNILRQAERARQELADLKTEKSTLEHEIAPLRAEKAELESMSSVLKQSAIKSVYETVDENDEVRKLFESDNLCGVTYSGDVVRIPYNGDRWAYGHNTYDSLKTQYRLDHFVQLRPEPTKEVSLKALTELKDATQDIPLSRDTRLALEQATATEEIIYRHRGISL
ncbi:MAG: hypothetical protein DUD31_10895 [Coriobacteriaceae bacterium]|nr:MAG: hypothetical protein DUD31_10895 [Coriobacteriaceae bacterium]